VSHPDINPQPLRPSDPADRFARTASGFKVHVAGHHSHVAYCGTRVTSSIVREPAHKALCLTCAGIAGVV
jgi:hypothetical protein